MAATTINDTGKAFTKLALDELFPDRLIVSTEFILRNQNEAPKKLRDFIKKIKAFSISPDADREELSWLLMDHFFPEHTPSGGRKAWHDLYILAMTPNPMGVTGVVISNPCATDCIRLAGIICDARS